MHTSWTPDVPSVTINLYQEGTAADGTPASEAGRHHQDQQLGRLGSGLPHRRHPEHELPGPGQHRQRDPFYFTLSGTPFIWISTTQRYNGGTPHTVPNNSQFKCYDGLHNFNQVQPAPYDGMYKFPSVTSRDPTDGQAETGTNCTICVANPDRVTARTCCPPASTWSR